MCPCFGVAQVLLAISAADGDTVIVEGETVVERGLHVLGDVRALQRDALGGLRYSSSNPDRCALVAAVTRLPTSSFLRMFVTCTLAVFVLMYKALPISALLFP